MIRLPWPLCSNVKITSVCSLQNNHPAVWWFSHVTFNSRYIFGYLETAKQIQHCLNFRWTGVLSPSLWWLLIINWVICSSNLFYIIIICWLLLFSFNIKFDGKIFFFSRNRFVLCCIQQCTDNTALWVPELFDHHVLTRFEQNSAFVLSLPLQWVTKKNLISSRFSHILEWSR